MTDGRKTGLSTQGYPLRKIVERLNGIHVLSCGHRLPKPAEATDYDLRKSRRCVECGPKPPRASVAAPQDDELLTTLKAAANYICRATSEHYDAVERDTVIKALTRWIHVTESSPVAPIPDAEQTHEFLQYPKGKFRDPNYNDGRCWHVVGHRYCGLPADADIHHVAATPSTSTDRHCPHCDHLMYRGTSVYERCSNCTYQEGVASSPAKKGSG